MMNDVEKAEFAQALKAFLIPSSLFLATLTGAAGAFLIYHGYSLGYAFFVASAATITAAFVAFFRFHNKLRAQGRFGREREDVS